MITRVLDNVRNGEKGYVFQCDNITDYRATMNSIPLADFYDANRQRIEQKYDITSNELLDKVNSGWFGDPTAVDIQEMVSEGIASFIDTPMLNAMRTNLMNIIPSEVKSKFKKRRFKFNRNFGVFSFDRAAAGLYWLDEFYCEKEGRAVAESETGLEPPQYGTRRFMKFPNSSNLDTKIVTEIKADHFADFPNSHLPLIGRKEARADGTPFVRTTVEDVFVFFPKKAKSDKSVLLCVNMISSADHSWQQMAYSGIAAGIIAELCSQAGIKVAIHGFYGTRDPFTRAARHGGAAGLGNHRFLTAQNPADQDVRMATIIPIKRFQDTLDINAIAVFSDSRFVRYEVYKNIFKQCDMLGRISDEGLGSVYPNASRDFDAAGLYDNTDLKDTTRVHVPQLDSQTEVTNFVERIATDLFT